MSSKSDKKDAQSSGGFHQEYIASLRYRNDLPPPDMPPKLLDIPHEGLSRFTGPGFASNLARREEPNIDVDAEGGMPIDLVGIPGLHLGDESGKRMPLIANEIGTRRLLKKKKSQLLWLPNIHLLSTPLTCHF